MNWNPTRSALILIDMERGFLDPGSPHCIRQALATVPACAAAVRTAREKGMKIIGFGGRDGGKMKGMCDLCLVAPTYSMEQIEDLHMFYVHSLVCTLREGLKRVWDVETVRYPQNRPEFAIFDFDGTVSLLNAWVGYSNHTEEYMSYLR